MCLVEKSVEDLLDDEARSPLANQYGIATPAALDGLKIV